MAGGVLVVDHEPEVAAVLERGRLRALSDVSRRLAAIRDHEDIVALVVNGSMQFLEAEAAILWLREGSELVVRGQSNSASSAMRRACRAAGESFSCLVLATGETIHVEDLSRDPRCPPEQTIEAIAHGLRRRSRKRRSGRFATTASESRTRRNDTSSRSSTATLLAADGWPGTRSRREHETGRRTPAAEGSDGK